VSAQSDWFKRFLAGDPAFRDFFIAVQGQPDLSAVVRPRALPLLTKFPSTSGPLQVWTTFSADQVDLNYKNPEVFLRTVDVLLTYVARGARFIRLDAIAFLWKELGTPCIHRLQTHRIIQLWRAILDQVAPGVQLVTETNVPHIENVSYFGDDNSEAQMVYNFALPPLVLHTFRQQNSAALTQWARELHIPSDPGAFFNFLASHDGIGLNPARGILGIEEINQLVADIQALGGFVSYKLNSNGTRSPYELNVNYYDALALPADQHNPELPINRFLTAHSIMLTLSGVPGIYFHSLVGSRGDRKGAETTNIPRRINRQKLERSSLENDLERSDSLRHKIFRGFRRLLRARRQHTAFSPSATQEILEIDPRAFVLRRGSAHSTNEAWCLHNVTHTPLELTLPATFIQNVPDPIDILSGARLPRSTRVCLEPYQSLWLTPGSPPTTVTRPKTP
jgi:glucosylglycerate phosphorylase